MGSHFTSKVIPVVGVNDSLTLNKKKKKKHRVGGMEVLEYDDKNLLPLTAIFFPADFIDNDCLT